MTLPGLLFLVLLALLAVLAACGALVLAWRDGYGTCRARPRTHSDAGR